jgi:putative transcriptional regulator
MEAIHSNIAGMYRAGTVDEETMRSFDESCLVVPEAIEPAAIKRVREAEKMSQRAFARQLNASVSTVQKWETGAKKPSGMALKLLSVVQKHGLKVLS